MGTSCRVGILVNGKVKSIYIRYDGYISGVGEYLIDEINTIEKMLEWIQHGDRHSIETEYKESEYVEETDSEFIGRGMKEFCEFFYLMKDGIWLVYPIDESKNCTFTPLSEKVTEEKKRQEELQEEFEKELLNYY